jgi:ubiquinone/menaquinone biosynthesis C-methylase UbiE
VSGDPDLPFTGERFVPGTRGEIWVEHWHRYHFAARWVRGKRVLDVACGEGYGAALLAREAAHVTGVDVAQPAIDHAKRVYGHVGNAEFVRASCTQLPLADGSVEAAVSFETLEHIEAQEAFLDEIARVLSPDGVLVLSCPNKLEYSDKRNYQNEFHVKELYRDALAALVQARFPHMRWHGQRPSFFSVIAPEDPQGAAAQLVEVTEAKPDVAAERLEQPLYFVVVASRSRAALDAVPAALSVLSDREEWMHNNYTQVIGELYDTHHRAVALDAQVARLGEAIATLHGEARQLQDTKEAVDRALAQREASIAGLNAELAARNATLIEKQHEIDRRRGWRWWVKLPLIRLGLMRQE